MDSKVFKILQELETHGVGVYTDISPLILQFYPNVNKMEQYEVFSTWGTVRSLLESMKKADFITTEQYPSFSGNNTNGYGWFDTLRLLAAITITGVAALENEKIKAQRKDLLNQSFRLMNLVAWQTLRQ